MPDLVIGGRRAGFPRPWRAAGIALAMLGVALIVAWFIYRRSVAYDMPGGEAKGEVSSVQAAPGAPPALAYGNASLAWLGGIPVLRAAGDAQEIGTAHGRLLAPWLRASVKAAAPSIEATTSDDGMLGGMTHGMRLAWRWRFVDDGFSDPDRRMVAGMTRGAEASGVGLAFEDLVRDQAVLDVGEPSQRTGEAAQHAIAHSLTILAQQAQMPARVWIGRAFELPGLDDGGDSALPLVTLAHPDGRIAWAGIGWPGQIGTVTGINAEGIAVLVDPARTADVRVARAARPVALLARAVLEQAKTLDEAVKLIEATPTLGSAVFVVVDGTSGKWVQIERTPQKAILERAPKVPVFGDTLTTNALAQDPENDRARRLLPTQARVDRAAKLVKAPLPDPAALAQILRDTRAPDDAQRPPGHRGAIDDGQQVHVAILDPASLALWVADPQAGGRMRAFDLRHELRGEGDRAAPPGDIAADPAAEIDRVAILAAARADLREARGLLAKGKRDAAAEACARARIRAPSLPEALELEGMIAAARGDSQRARSAFGAWLDAGPDDPKGEEAARATLAR